MKNNQFILLNFKDKIIQKCFAISELSTMLGKMSLLKNIDIKKFERLKKAQEEFIEELIKICRGIN